MSDIRTQKLREMLADGIGMMEKGRALRNEALRRYSSILERVITKRCKDKRFIFDGEDYSLANIHVWDETDCYGDEADGVEVYAVFLHKSLADMKNFTDATKSEKKIIGELADIYRNVVSAMVPHQEEVKWLLIRAHELQGSAYCGLRSLKHKLTLVKEFTWTLSLDEIMEDGSLRTVFATGCKRVEDTKLI